MATTKLAPGQHLLTIETTANRGMPHEVRGWLQIDGKKSEWWSAVSKHDGKFRVDLPPTAKATELLAQTVEAAIQKYLSDALRGVVETPTVVVVKSHE